MTRRACNGPKQARHGGGQGAAQQLGDCDALRSIPYRSRGTCPRGCSQYRNPGILSAAPQGAPSMTLGPCTRSSPALTADICPAPRSTPSGMVPGQPWDPVREAACGAAQVSGGLRISQAAVYSGGIASPGVRRRIPSALPLWKPSARMSCVGGPLAWGSPQRGSRTT
jgi:hypothetical protein